MIDINLFIFYCKSPVNKIFPLAKHNAVAMAYNPEV